MIGLGADRMNATAGTARREIASDADVRTVTNVMERDVPGMITYEQIAELSDETSLPLIDIIRALARCAGDSEAARTKLMNGGHIDVADRKVAENLAMTLVEEGLCFSCETTPDDHWRFRVPAEYVARACTLTYVSRVRALKAGLKEEASERRAAG
jgi:hypothetical protein